MTAKAKRELILKHIFNLILNISDFLFYTFKKIIWNRWEDWEVEKRRWRRGGMCLFRVFELVT